MEKPLIVEPEVERLEKLERYFLYFNIEARYGIDFKEFCRKVENGTWQAYLAS